jgi:UDP-2,3-diacylglucosamine pyrophosphatase LpxH
MPHKTYFVSDLHLFSRRSQGLAQSGALQAAAARAGTFILGGDIFDFRWSTHGTSEATTWQAIRWLDELVGSHPHCDFHFVLGNHDCNGRFVAALAQYAKGRPSLLVHPFVLRLDTRVFLHGDAADHPTMCQQRLTKRREHWSRDETRSEMRHALYDLAVSARLHCLAGQVAHPRKRVVRRIVGYLDRVRQGPDQGAEHVYFGHTHDELNDFRFQGVTFHNPGAPIPGLRFRIVEVG